MAAARLDLPTIFLTGGPSCWNIRFHPGRKKSVDHKDYADFGQKIGTFTAATCGACEIMGTANTTQCLAEAMGLTLPGSANVPAYHAEKTLFARKSGIRIVEMVEEGLTARKILTPDAIENAVIVDLAIAGSTNSTLHLPAIAHELGFELPLSRFNELNEKMMARRATSGYYRWVLRDKSRLAVSIRDSLNTDAELDAPDPFVFTLRTDPFIMPTHRTMLRDCGAAVGVRVHRLADWEETARRTIEKYLAKPTRVVCLKSGLAYHRSLHYAKVSPAAAEREFNEFFRNAHSPAWRGPIKPGQAFQDHMQHVVCRIADEHGLTRAVGYLTRILDRVEKDEPPAAAGPEWSEGRSKLLTAVYLTRARLEIARRRYQAAMADLQAAEKISPTAEARLRMGEVGEIGRASCRERV